MPVFEEGYDYTRFANAVTLGFRYRLNEQSERFLSALISQPKTTVLTKDTLVWRAQLGVGRVKEVELNVFEFPAHPPERMLPLSDSATEGRANSKGLPVLYAASDKETAMSEVRPNRASEISLATLEILRDLRLVDCTSHQSVRSHWEYPGHAVPENEKDAVVWRDINDAFVRPVDGGDQQAEYAPTQILAECFKRAGFDGIRYGTGYDTGGHNYALFDLNSVIVKEVVRAGVRFVRMEFYCW
jgi:hypothetical protein